MKNKSNNCKSYLPMSAKIESCKNCRHAVRPARNKQPLVTNWLTARGLAYCEIYGERLGRRYLIPLINAAGTVCGGRDYLPKEMDLFESALSEKV